MGDNTQTQTGGLFTNPNQEPVTTPEVSATTPETTPSVFQSIDQTTSVTPDASAIAPEVAIVSEISQPPVVTSETSSMTADPVMPSVSEPTPVSESVIQSPTSIDSATFDQVTVSQPVMITEPVLVPEIVTPIEPAVQTSPEPTPAPSIEPAAPEIKSHIGDPISLGSLGEFAGINLGSLIQSASSSAVSTSTPQPAISPEASKTKKIVLIAMSIVGLLLLVGAGVWMMSVMDPLAGQDTGTTTDTGAIASGDIVSGTQGNSEVLSGGELTGTELTGTTGEPENTGNSTEPSIIDPLTNGGTNNAALVDTKQISEAINAKMKAAYEVAKTAKSASNLEAAKKALLAYGMMKKMLTKLENGEYTTNEQAFTELSEYQSQVDAATQLMNGN